MTTCSENRSASVHPSPERLARIENAGNAVLLFPSFLPRGLCGKPHRHGLGQLIFPKSGRFQVFAAGGVWTGSPRQAMWIPPGVEHGVQAMDDLFVHNVYVSTHHVGGLPTDFRVVEVTPLLQELLAHGLSLPASEDHAEERQRILLVITDQIRHGGAAGVGHLPMAEGGRLHPLLAQLAEDPGDARGLEHWAGRLNVSPRTLARLFVQETGLTFREWRQRLRVMEAMSRLRSGQSVLQVAMDLGYDSQSAFAVMFRRIMGSSPSQWRAGAAPQGLRPPGRGGEAMGDGVLPSAGASRGAARRLE